MESTPKPNMKQSMSLRSILEPVRQCKCSIQAVIIPPSASVATVSIVCRPSTVTFVSTSVNMR